jgi:hypothetical protein
VKASGTLEGRQQIAVTTNKRNLTIAECQRMDLANLCADWVFHCENVCYCFSAKRSHLKLLLLYLQCALARASIVQLKRQESYI